MNHEAIIRGVRMLKIVKAGANGLRRLHTSNKVRKDCCLCGWLDTGLFYFVDLLIGRCWIFVSLWNEAEGSLNNYGLFKWRVAIARGKF